MATQGFITATTEHQGLDQIVAALGTAGRYFDSPQAMTPAVRAAGAGWMDNYNKSGARVGGWKPLKEYTVREREARGYPGQKPILRQSGGLVNGAIVPFVRWSETQAGLERHIAPTPGKRFSELGDERQETFASGPTWVTGKLTPRRFWAEVSGAKAMNQTGGNLPSVSRWRGFSKLTARPFWFFDQMIVDQAASGIVGRFEFYTFRYMPKVTGISTRGWSQSMGAPGRPGISGGPMRTVLM